MMPAALRRRVQPNESNDVVGVGAHEVTEMDDESIRSDSARDADSQSNSDEDTDAQGHRHDGRDGIQWRRILTYGLLPGLTLFMAMGAGYLKWYDWSLRESRLAAVESVQAASDGAVAMLSYRPDTVEKDLGAARDRLTGALKDSYGSLIRDLVIPGSKQKMISASASVPAAAAVSASPNHAVVLMFVNQTILIGSDPPSNTASRVRVTLDKVYGRWLISSFDPI